MDWPRHNPSPPTFGIRSQPLRCYLYDPTSPVSPSFSLFYLPLASSLLIFLVSLSLFLSSSSSSFSLALSFSLPSLAVSLFLRLSLSPFRLSLSRSFPSFLLSSVSLLTFSVSFPPGSRFLSSALLSRARYILTVALLTTPGLPRPLLQFESYLPARCPPVLSDARSPLRLNIRAKTRPTSSIRR